MYVFYKIYIYSNITRVWGGGRVSGAAARTGKLYKKRNMRGL